MMIRAYRPGEIDCLCRLAVEAFNGVSLDQNLEALFGAIQDHDWSWRKARQIEADVTLYPEGVFVAEVDGQVIGFLTTRVDAEAGLGQIPNLAVDVAARNQGVGRQLIERAFLHFSELGIRHVRIETLEQNAAGKHLYPALGFQEVGRQIHYAIDLQELAPPD